MAVERMDKPMSNKDVAIYMIPACCVLGAAVALESRTVLAIVFLIVAGIVVFAKEKKGASAHEKKRKTDAEFNNISHTKYITHPMRYGRTN